MLSMTLSLYSSEILAINCLSKIISEVQVMETPWIICVWNSGEAANYNLTISCHKWILG